ncbi:hypothetical protein QE361_001467 [Sphingomonas sp. SORGH_AS802]|uniref:hypothetical protein n=1 Tax=unclassified Sphingomonas TaxID=196159 RepID=UPI002863BA35|nr:MULTISPECIES: hypothetical protein [unclassified Sphingomonas]MDR6125885.1 hypothetical protein [Sphingomonas sp. SORGH_AS_0438]MDR6134492.1 hypothetical protein [Sphingomonas sp. SORGH_AS_0802]
MNDNEPWPRIGQAMNSHVVRTLAHAARWRLTDMPADLGLPLAGCLYSEANHLLVTTTIGNLAASIAAMDSALLATRSDALIVRAAAEDGMPGFALGLWHSGRVIWHWMLTLWVGVDAGLWLVPTPDKRDGTAASGFRLTARHLRVEEVPWRTAHERADGLVRAIRMLVHGERGTASGPADGDDRS